VKYRYFIKWKQIKQNSQQMSPLKVKYERRS